MRKLLLINGPNLNKLGERDPELYGSMTLRECELILEEKARFIGFDLLTFQSNHEGAIIDFIQEQSGDASGMIINPGALSHTSYVIHDAIIDSQLPTIEVHLSNIKAREPWRAHSVIEAACLCAIIGKKFQGYLEALSLLAEHLSDAD